MIGINFFIVFILEMDVERIEVYIKINLYDFEYNIVLVFFIWDSYIFNFKIKSMYNNKNSF